MYDSWSGLYLILVNGTRYFSLLIFVFLRTHLKRVADKVKVDETRASLDESQVEKQKKAYWKKKFNLTI